MTFIHMTDIGLHAHRHQRANTADAHQNLLTNALAAVAPVKPIGDVAVVGTWVVGDIGIQQVKRDTPHLDFPDLRVQLTSGQIH